MSQAKLAAAASVSVTTVVNLERGHAAQYETIGKLAKALEVDVQDLINGST
jgi:transcriptional regulator with XRE-family HTH domain